MPHAAARGQALLGLAAVGQQGYTVAGMKGHLRQAERGVYRVVELGEAADARAQKAAGIQDQPHGLAALNLMNLGDEFSAPGGSAPGDIAEFVAGAVLAQAFELPALAAQAPRVSFPIRSGGCESR